MGFRYNNGNDGFSIEQRLSFAMSSLSEGCFNDAATIFKEILKRDFSNESAEMGVKCCNYWKIKIEKLKKEKDKKSFSCYKIGNLLYEEWEKFALTFSSSKETKNRVLNCIMQYVLGLALEYLIKAEIDGEASINIVQLFMLIGFINKELGNLNDAICYFQKAIRTEGFNADAYAQLSNCYELQGDERAAKIMLREAFFLNPAGIDLAKLENSQLITKIYCVMKQYDIAEETFVFWMPVYARIYNILDIKRELKSVEVAKIHKDISDIKNELESNTGILKNKNETEKIKAILLIRYLWLYDYFQENGNNREEIKKVEDAIKDLSFTIYNIFKNSI